MMSAIVNAITKGNQRPSRSFVEVDAKKIKSRTSKLPFTV
jgi:hypothetical protein